MLSFPKDISSSADVFHMTPVGYHVQAGGHKVNKNIDTAKSICLPTPSSGITLSEGGSWDETDSFQTFSAASLLGKAVKKTIENVGDIAKQAVRGFVLNDYASLSYNGSNFRTYSFQWDLIPSSEIEAIEIAKIIQTIRYYSLPSYIDNGYALTYPSMWRVYPAARTEMNILLKDCVIETLNVNYTPDGVLKQYNSGHPVSVSLELSFKELYRADRSDIEGNITIAGAATGMSKDLKKLLSASKGK